MSSGEKELAKEVYNRVFEATSELIGWDIGIDGWTFIPKDFSPLTRDEAFKNVCNVRR